MSISSLPYYNNINFITNSTKKNNIRNDVSFQNAFNDNNQKLSTDNYKSYFLNFNKISFREIPQTLTGLDAVAGREKLKQQVRERIINPLKDETDYLEYKVPVQKGIIFYGPTGNGKTSFVQHLIEELRNELNKPIPFFKIETSKLEGKFVGDFAKQLDALIEKAKKHIPAVIFLDEAERFLGKRNERSEEWEFKADQTNEILIKIEEAEKEGIIFIAATNNIDKIDPAALRNGRLGEQIYMGLPDLEARIDFIKLQLMLRTPGQELAQQTSTLKLFAEKLHKYSFADIEQVVDNAAFFALQRKKKTGNKEPITFADLQYALIKLENSHSKLLEEISK